MSDSSFFGRNSEKIIREYNSGKSVMQLAEEYGTYPQKIIRVIKKYGGKIRSKSESQKLALENGRAILPTSCIEYTEEKRQKISEKMHEVYHSLSDEQKEQRREKSKAQYAAMSDEAKEELRKKSSQAILKASKEGSKLEKFLLDKLTEMGYSIVFHKKGYILNDNLEIDLLIPAMKVAIEVDGVYHSKDIHGDLPKVANRDNEKNGLLLSYGYIVIRLSNTVSTVTPYYLRERLQRLTEVLDKIKIKFPPFSERLIFIP